MMRRGDGIWGLTPDEQADGLFWLVERDGAPFLRRVPGATLFSADFLREADPRYVQVGDVIRVTDGTRWITFAPDRMDTVSGVVRAQPLASGGF